MIDSLKDQKEHSWHWSVSIVATAVVYFAFARLGLLMATLNQSASPVWPATGFAIAAAVYFGPKALFGIALGAFAANALTPVGLLSSLFMGLGNSFEAGLAAYICRKIGNKDSVFEFQTEAASLLLGAVAGSTIAATVGTSCLHFFNHTPVESLKDVWTTWWVGDVLGGLTLAPVMSHVLRRLDGPSDHDREPIFLTFILVLLSTLSTYFILVNSWQYTFLFLLFPLLLLSGFSVGAWTMRLSTLAICVVSIWVTFKGEGPFRHGTVNENLIHLQLYLAALTVTSILLVGFIRIRILKLPALILFLGWALTATFLYSFEKNESLNDEKKFDSLVNEVHDLVQKRVDTYFETMRAGVALHAASKEVSYSEWKNFVESIQIVERHPGILGLGITWVVPHKDLNAFTKKMASEGVKNFFPHTVSREPLEHKSHDGNHYIIKYLEPHTANSPALGLAINSENERLSAALRARDTGLPTSTAQIQLVQTEDSKKGFLLFMPIYQSGHPISTVEGRRKNFLGWIYAPFVTESLLKEALLTSSNEVELTALENGDVPIFSSGSRVRRAGQHERVTSINLGQRFITIGWNKSETFVSSRDSVTAWVGFCGALVSLLLAMVVVSLQLIGRKSNEIAIKLTADVRATSTKLETLLNSSPLGIFVLNRHNQMTLWNPACEKMFGWTAAECLGGFFPFVPPEKTAESMAMIKKIHAAREPVRFFADRRKKNGDTIKIEVAATPILDAANEIDGLMAVVRDITETSRLQEDLQNAHADLRETSERHHLITNNIPALIAYWDKDLRCQYANKTYCDWMGLSFEMAKGRTLQEIFGVEVYAPHEPCIRAALAGIPQRFERELIRQSDNAIRHVQVHYIPDISEGDVRGYFALVSDVTDQKEAQIKAMEASKFKSDFLANMSHEIRTPLNGIIGMTDLMLETDMDKNQRTYAEVVRQSGTSLLGLINDLLDFSKVEAGKMELENVDFSMVPTVEVQAEILIMKARSKNISLVTYIDPQLPTHFKGDPGRLGQILLNLIGNSIKFTEKGGVTLRVLPAVPTSSSPNTQNVRFEVEDTGIGISEHHQAKLFQPFTQADASTSRKFGGTGLGLSICKHLVEMMGGHIGLISNEGQGTTFWFELPLYISRVAEATSKKQSEEMHSQRLLVVNSEPVTANIVKRYAECWGVSDCRLVHSNNAIAQIHQAKEKSNPFTLVLVDTPMSHDLELIKSAKASGAHMILMTEFEKPVSQKEASDLGYDQTLSKPLKQSSLFDAIMHSIHGMEFDYKAEQNKEIEKQKAPTHRRILIADDVPANQMIAARQVENLGHSAHCVANGKEAIEALELADYDLVLMDCQMPEMDGFEATTLIRKSSKSRIRQVPVIALTANAMDGDAKRCLDAGMDDYLPKPIKKDQLKACFEKWLAASQKKKSA